MNPDNAPTSRQPPARGRARASAVWVLSLSVFTALPALAALPARPAPALVRQADIARQAMEQLDRLKAQAEAAGTAANQLEQAGRNALFVWQEHQQADERARAALMQAEACLPLLQQSLDADASAMDSHRHAVARSQAAVQSVAQAEGDALAPAAQAADAAFQQRMATEKALADQLGATRRQSGACEGHNRMSDWSVQNSLARALEAVDRARTLPHLEADLRMQWQRTSAAAAAAQKAGLLPPTGVTLANADHERLQALQQALAATGLPERGLAQTPQRVAPLPPSRPDLDQLGSELERLQDALAFIDLSAPPGTASCVDAGCTELQAERRELAARLVATQARMQQAVAQWQQSSATLRAQLQPLTSARKALAARLQAVGSTLGPAVNESTQASRAALAAVQQLQSAIAPARERARLAWEQAYRLAYGAPPPSPRPAAAQVLTRDDGSTMAAAGMATMVRPAIRSHAYEGFSRFDGESSDFGAYTYVLLRSASDLQNPAVRQRFLHLLRSLQTLPSASLVDGSDKPYVNVFCVPVTPGHEGTRDASELVYASDLGQQIKMRAQNGLLTQKPVRQRLTSAPGPFLITVPGRLSQAQTGTPLLMADLSNYPPEAIADLVHQYMNGLVDDFPRQQALWQPPVLQRVALLMIHLAEGTGQLVTSALPTAQAQPR